MQRISALRSRLDQQQNRLQRVPCLLLSQLLRKFAVALTLILLWLAVFPALAATEELLDASLPDQVHSIFQAKCVECHGSDLARPKGKFGYVLDLARMAANPDMVVPGKAEDSELYQLVLNDEMPGDDASVPPLTPDEKNLVKRWIETGASHQVSSKTPKAIPQITAAPSTPVRHLTWEQRLVRALGQFHPPSAHFPIALLIAALPAEFMWKRTRNHSWKAVVRFCVTLGAISSVFTAGLGWCDAAFSSYTSISAPILVWHRWLGTATAVWAVLTAGLSELAHREGQPRRLRYLFRLVLGVGIILVSVAGYFGASLVYGIDHFTW